MSLICLFVQEVDLEHKFKLHGFTYIWMFSICTIVLHDQWMVESADVETWVQTDDSKVICRFLAVCGSAHPPLMLFKGQM